VAKEFFKVNNVQFTNYDVSIDVEKRAEMVQKSGQMGVPVIFVDGEMIIGFDEGKIKLLLEI